MNSSIARNGSFPMLALRQVLNSMILALCINTSMPQNTGLFRYRAAFRPAILRDQFKVRLYHRF